MSSESFVELHSRNFREFRNAVLGATQAELALLLSLSVPTVQAIEGQELYRMRRNRVATISMRLGVPIEEFEEVFGPKKWADSYEVRERSWVKQLWKRLLQMRNQVEDHDRWREGAVKLAVRRIPYFEFKMPAGRWAESGEPRGADAADGWTAVDSDVPGDAFALRIHGDCMEPDYPDGSILIFVPVGPDGDGLRKFESGRDYYFEHTDGKATFKRVFYEPQSERFRLESINKKFKPFHVPEQMLARMSRAVKMLRDLT